MNLVHTQNIPKKLTFFTPDTHKVTHQGLKNISFSENHAYVQNESSQTTFSKKT